MKSSNTPQRQEAYYAQSVGDSGEYSQAEEDCLFILLSCISISCTAVVVVTVVTVGRMV